MIETRELLRRARLDRAALDAWVEVGWLLPGYDAQARSFSEIDLARACLIRDLKQDLGVNDEAVDVILDLIDQIHGLRRSLRDVLFSIQAEPYDTRQRIVATARVNASGRDGDEFSEAEGRDAGAAERGK
jgi:chaperone modulatory protein CbpM